MKIEVIAGPTASGKTALALERAIEDTTVEIVNADASLLYKGFDIGTAKPTLAERSIVPHHLIDILEPTEVFSAAEYSGQARQHISEILSHGRRPIVVGGTGFYIDALFYGLSPIEAAPEQLELARKQYDNLLDEKGFDVLLKELEAIDLSLFKQIERERNPRRLQRAWEFYFATGTPLGEARLAQRDVFEYGPDFTILQPEREVLLQRIEQRIHHMIEAGWLEEVQQLLERGITTDMPAMKAIGYRTLVEVLRSEKELSTAIEEIIIQTRQYAKRQVTWFKRYQL